MSYLTNYIVPDMLFPEHEDKVAQTLRTAFMLNTTWLQYCLLMTHRTFFKDGKEYPSYLEGNNKKDYRKIAPDDHTQSIGFFEINSDPEFYDNDEPTKYDMSFVWWGIQSKINAVANEDITNGLINEIIKILRVNGCDEITKTTDLSKIFNYSGIELKTVQMTGNNFKAFRISFNYYQNECLRPHSANSY